ncbi:MAG: HesA/MoeB/ThiF family protein, partial [Bacteroidota bacterium]
SRTTLFTEDDIGKSKAEVAAQRANELALHENPEFVGLNGKIEDFGAGFFCDHDIIISCVDVESARAYINDWCVILSKPFFEMGFRDFRVSISFFNATDKNSPCLRSWIGQGERDGKRNSCSGLKMKDQNLEHIPTIQVAAAMAGVLIATELVKFIEGTATLLNKTLMYNGRDHSMMILENKKSRNCFIHEKTGMKVVESTLTANHSVKEILESLKNGHNKQYFLKFPQEFVVSASCRSCGKNMIIQKRKSKLYHEDLWCAECREETHMKDSVNAAPEILNELIPVNPVHKSFLEKPLDNFGYLKNDLIEIESLDGSEQFLVKIEN